MPPVVFLILDSALQPAGAAWVRSHHLVVDLSIQAGGQDFCSPTLPVLMHSFTETAIFTISHVVLRLVIFIAEGFLEMNYVYHFLRLKQID